MEPDKLTEFVFGAKVGQMELFQSSLSQFLEHKFGQAGLDYGTTTTYSPEQQEVALSGTSFLEHNWKSVLGFVRPSTLRTIVTRDKMSWDECLQTLGLSINMSEKKQVTSVGKRLGRIFAPQHAGFWPGLTTNIETNKLKTVISFKLNEFPGRTFTHCIYHHGFGMWPEEATDGCGLLDYGLVKLLKGREVPEGSVFQFTGLGPLPMGCQKGHGVVMRNLAYDLITYEAKDEVSSSDDFYLLAFLNAVHPSRAMTDIQSIINLGLDKVEDGKYLQRLAAKHMVHILNTVQDRPAFEFELNKSHHCDEEGEFIENPSWVEAQAHLNGAMSMTKDGERVVFPALEEKWIRRQMEGKRNMLINRFRFVEDEDTIARYIFPDLTCFDRWGMVHVDDGTLAEDECFTSQEGECAFYRTPMAHTCSFTVQKSVMRQELFVYDQGVLIMFNPKRLAHPEFRKKHGGQDCDDRGKAMFNKAVVKHVKDWVKAFPYPDVALPVAITPEEQTQSWDDVLLEELSKRKKKGIRYNADVVGVALLDAQRNNMSIGVIDAIIRKGIAFETNKPEMIAKCLAEGNQDLADAIAEFNGFGPAILGCNIESLIDSINKTGNRYAFADQWVSGKGSFDNTIPAVPGAFWTHCSKRGDGNALSKTIRDRSIPIIRVHMDDVHDMVERYKELIMEVEVKKYLQSHAFVPGEEFSTHPYVHDKAMAVAQEMRTMFRVRFQQIKRHVYLTGFDVNPEISCTCPKEGEVTKCNSIGDQADKPSHIVAALRAQEELAEFADGKWEYNKDGSKKKLINPGHPLGKDAWLRLVYLVYRDRASNVVRTVDAGEGKLKYTSYGDAMLWGANTGQLTLDVLRRVGLAKQPHAVEWLNGQVRHDYKDYFGPVQVKDTLVYIPGTTSHIGFLAVEDGMHELVYGHVWVEVGPDNRPSSPMTVVNGWEQRFHTNPESAKEELVQWKALSGKQAVVEPSMFAPPKGKPQKAAKVFVDSKHVGWITREDLCVVGGTTHYGVLVANTEYTLRFVPEA